MNKQVLITGASSGIGKEYTFNYAKQKYNLILVARNKTKLNKIKKELVTKYNIKCKIIICDLSKPIEIQKLIKKIKLEKIEILINNAGFGEKNTFNLSKITTDENMINVHVLATTLLTKSVYNKMLKQNSGTIINVASIAGYLYTSKSNIIYNSTKRYIIHFSKCLQEEINSLNKNIKVQALCPGFTKTNFNKTKIFERMFPKIYSFMYMDAKDVVTQSIKALKNKSVVYTPGKKNKLARIYLKIKN